MASRHGSQKIASETAGIALGEKKENRIQELLEVFFWPIIVKPGLKEHYTKAVGVALSSCWLPLGIPLKSRG